MDALTRPELTMPKPAAKAVRIAYASARHVLEYGSGGSTVLAAERGTPIHSVECDPEWAAKMRRWFDANPPKAALHLHEVDIGPVGEWARPLDDSRRDHWPDYPNSVWDRADFIQPEAVLIDGRFRVACLLTTAFRSKAPVTVLFDDYAGRPAYHIVERMFRPVAMHGRMAQFQIDPTPVPADREDWVNACYGDPN